MAVLIPPVAPETRVLTGGTVRENIHDLGGGYRAVVTDPFGNALGITQRPTELTTDAPPAGRGEAA